MMREFERDDLWQSRLAVKFLNPLYQSRGWKVCRYPGDHEMQRFHVDVTLSRGGEFLHIDEKIIRGRRDGYPAIKVNLETWSCSVQGSERRGWIAPDEPNKSTTLLICFADVSDLGEEAWQKVTVLDC